MQIGVIDAGNFKGVKEIVNLKNKIIEDGNKYVELANRYGYYAESITSSALDVEAEVLRLAPSIVNRFPNTVFFGGQIVLPKDTFMTRLLHNFTVFSLQRKLYTTGMEFIILPIKL